MALARLAPGRWPSMLHGIALACVAICGWALLTKIFPGALAEDEIYARLRAPFDYWNSVGLTAAIGVLALLWLGARRSGRPALNALAWPGIALLEVALMLSYSRGALLALLAGLAFWFAVVPLRLRGAVVLLGATAGAAALVGWAFTMTGLTTERLPLAGAGRHRARARRAAAADARAAAGRRPRRGLPRRRAAGLAAGQAGRGPRPARACWRPIPVILLVALASAPGGIDGQVSKTWDQLTNPSAATPANTPDRLTATSSVRARYWEEAFDVHGVSPWVGTGAGAYATVRNRFRTGTLYVRHAHGYVPQTLADLGWAGLALSLLALALWGWAALRAVGTAPARPRAALGRRASRQRDAARDRARVRRQLARRLDLVRAGQRADGAARRGLGDRAPAAARAAGGGAGGGGAAAARGRAATARAPAVRCGRRTRARPRRRRRTWADRARCRSPRRNGAGARPFPWLPAAAAVLVVAFALAAAWSAFQPVRALHAGNVAIERLERGELEAAVSIAQIAHDRNPLSPEPLWELGYIEQQRGRLANAEEALEEAVRVQPASAETWRRLGRFQLSTL